MIYDYVQTKPPMEEVIEHGWAKDAAAKVHKYLERHRNAAGKWVYTYYQKAKRALTAKADKEARLDQARNSRRKNRLDRINKTKNNRITYGKVLKSLRVSADIQRKRRKKYVDKKDAAHRKTNRQNYETQKEWRNQLREDARKKAAEEAYNKKRKKDATRHKKRQQEKKDASWYNWLINSPWTK